MRNDMLGGGIVLFILGLFFWFFIGPAMLCSGMFGLSYDMLAIGAFFTWIDVIMVLIGIILIIVGAIISPKEIYLHTHPNFYHPIQTNAQTNDMICGGCGRSIPSDANICPYCEKEFGETNKTEFCPECGTKLSKGSKFCFECGFKLR